MAKALLINLPFQTQVEAVAQTSVGPPMGLAYVAAVLLQQGHDVRLVDANALGMSFSALADEMKDFSPHMVGTTAATPSIGLAARLGEVVRETLPGNVPLVAGGSHGSALPAETLAEFPTIDVVVTGEAEAFAGDLLTALAGGDDLSSIPSLAFRRDGRTLVTERAPPVHDLDTLPFPARELLPNHLYRTIDSWPMTCIIAMRGCPAKCIYCNVPVLAGRTMRRRSPSNVVAEMELCLAEWQVPFFSFIDDTFTTSRKWIEQFCDTVKDAGLGGRKIAWSCLTRPDMADVEMLSAMKEAGMVRVEFGIESGSPQVLELLGKGAQLEQIRKAFKAAHKVGLATLGFAMINAPGETPEEMEMTRKEVMSIDPLFLQLSFCTPYPGTPLHEHCVEHGLIEGGDWSDYRFLREPVIRNSHLSPDEVKARHREILRSFYFRPGKALRLARYALANRRTASSLARTSLQALGHLLGGARRKKGA